jgi:glutathione synthase/RimK-type ligase-like ATP-grasp enzyme
LGARIAVLDIPMPSFDICIGERCAFPENYDVAWIRWKYRPVERIVSVEDQIKRTNYLESAATIFGLLKVAGKPVLNDRDRSRPAGLKLWQLHLAKTLGLPVLETIVTTSTESCLRFIKNFDNVVNKNLGTAQILRTDSEKQVVFQANRVKDSDFHSFDDVLDAPVCLQREPNKVADIRIVVAGTECFAFRIVPTITPRHSDWRTYYGRVASSDGVEIPHDIRTALFSYMQHEELFSGVFDFIEDSNGNWWFLECNPEGQWYWLELETGVQLSNAFAGQILERASQ